jgi:hypothetical protein
MKIEENIMNNNQTLIWKTVFILFYVNLASMVYAYNLDLPASNPEVISSFYNDSLSLLTFMDKVKIFDEYRWEYSPYSLRNIFEDKYHNSIPFYFNGYVFGSLANSDVLGRWQYNTSIGRVIRISDYFSIPLFFSAVGAKISDNSTDVWKTLIYNSLYTGTGLIFSCKYGTIGGFVGYYNFWGDAILPMSNLENNEWQGYIKYGIIPVLDTTQYPFLKYVLKGIHTYLSFDFEKSKLDTSSYSTKIISRSIPIIEKCFSIDSIYYSYTDQYLSAAAKVQGHGAGINFGIFDVFFIEYETGIQKASETIPSILKYSRFEIDSYTWYHSIFLGVQGGDIMTVGMIFSNKDYQSKFSIVADVTEWAFGMTMGDAPSLLYKYQELQDRKR